MTFRDHAGILVRAFDGPWSCTCAAIGIVVSAALMSTDELWPIGLMLVGIVLGVFIRSVSIYGELVAERLAWDRAIQEWEGRHHAG